MSRSYKKPYRGSKNFDRSCRCHGGCDYCKGNRLYNDKKGRDAADKQLTDYQKGEQPK